VSEQPAGPVVEDQSEVFAWLADPASHRGEKVVRVDTHGAALFLAGPDVYKLKRAVRFPFMDFSTLEKRRAACESEIAVNRPNAPQLYLGALPIRRSKGALHIGGEDGDIVEWAVHIRRFDETATLDRLAERDALGSDLAVRLAGVVVAAHGRAPVLRDAKATRTMRAQLDETMQALARLADIFEPQAVAALSRALTTRFDARAPLLEAREQAGFVRHCHGDLHLRNIVLIDDEPVLFDAIEFDPAIATCDILYDLAFLLMDLWSRGLRLAASIVFNRYLWASESPEAHLSALSVLAPFLALRAAIRARVVGEQVHMDPQNAGTYAAEAAAHFAAACGFLEVGAARLVAVGGLSGAGKTSLARLIAAKLAPAPGAVHLRSDVERKRLCGVGELERLPATAYTPEAATQVYDRLRRLAACALGAGHSVIIDAVHKRDDEREAVAGLAAEHGVGFAGFWLEAPLDFLRARVTARRGDASDASAETVDAQAAEPSGAIGWTRLSAGEPVAVIAAEAEAVLGLSSESVGE